MAATDADGNYHDEDAAALRHGLVDQLKGRGVIHSSHVEAAFRMVPRHLFVPDSPLDEAYSDNVIATKQVEGRSLSSASQPTIMALMLEALDLQPGHRVLEIGAGTGYNAALMAHIVGRTGRVVTVDIDEDIVIDARRHLAYAGFDDVIVIHGDGGYGFAPAAPYDRIILTVSAADITPAWRDQLRQSGRLLLPLMLNSTEEVTVTFARDGDSLFSRRTFGSRFIPLRGEFARRGAEPLPIGRDPGLYLICGPETDADPEQVSHFLSSRSRYLETGVLAAAEEVIGSLSSWLSLMVDGFCQLVADDRQLNGRRIPFAAIQDGETRVTYGIYDAGHFCLLSWPREKLLAIPRRPKRRHQALLIRFFDDHYPLAKYLAGAIRRWDAAGRPSLRDLSIRAYPHDMTVDEKTGDQVITRQWSTFVLQWERPESGIVAD